LRLVLQGVKVRFTVVDLAELIVPYRAELSKAVLPRGERTAAVFTKPRELGLVIREGCLFHVLFSFDILLKVC